MFFLASLPYHFLLPLPSTKQHITVPHCIIHSFRYCKQIKGFINLHTPQFSTCIVLLNYYINQSVSTPLQQFVYYSLCLCTTFYCILLLPFCAFSHLPRLFRIMFINHLTFTIHPQICFFASHIALICLLYFVLAMIRSCKASSDHG